MTELAEEVNKTDVEIVLDIISRQTITSAMEIMAIFRFRNNWSLVANRTALGDSDVWNLMRILLEDRLTNNLITNHLERCFVAQIIVRHTAPALAPAPAPVPAPALAPVVSFVNTRNVSCTARSVPAANDYLKVTEAYLDWVETNAPTPENLTAARADVAAAELVVEAQIMAHNVINGTTSQRSVPAAYVAASLHAVEAARALGAPIHDVVTDRVCNNICQRFHCGNRHLESQDKCHNPMGCQCGNWHLWESLCCVVKCKHRCIACAIAGQMCNHGGCGMVSPH